MHGLGVDPVCFNAPSILPVNFGPDTLTTAMLQYASTTLGAKSCAAFSGSLAAPMSPIAVPLHVEKS